MAHIWMTIVWIEIFTLCLIVRKRLKMAYANISTLVFRIFTIILPNFWALWGKSDGFFKALAHFFSETVRSYPKFEHRFQNASSYRNRQIRHSQENFQIGQTWANPTCIIMCQINVFGGLIFRLCLILCHILQPILQVWSFFRVNYNIALLISWDIYIHRV